MQVADGTIGETFAKKLFARSKNLCSIVPRMDKMATLNNSIIEICNYSYHDEHKITINEMLSRKFTRKIMKLT